jgi:hypothetical protein
MSLSKKLGVLSEVMKPSNIVIDDSQIYITENTSIYIYSLNDLKFKKKFGKVGEGPKEFKNFVVITPGPDHLLINSLGKISFYTKDGVFKKEIKTKAGIGSALFLPIKEGFIGRGVRQENKIFYITINFYDSGLKKGKELYRMKSPFQQSGKIELLSRTFVYKTHENIIFVAGKEGFIIDVLDHTGKLLFFINQKYEKRKFTPADEKKFRDYFQTRFKAQYEAVKNRISFPNYYPEIIDFFITDNKIYVLTWKWEKEKIEFLIFNLKGKLIKKNFIPFVFQNALQAYPWAIKKGNLYQIIEDEDTEEWELHISEIK